MTTNSTRIVGLKMPDSRGADSDAPLGPLVSIVTPSYNQAEFVESTIKSVLSQTYSRIEYFVCDGGSQDGTLEIIRRYSDRLAWWCSERDRGQSDAINKGWHRASGDILAYLNSDDLLLPGAIEHVVRAFRSSESIGVVHGDWIYVDEKGGELGLGRGRSADFKRLLRHGQIRYIAQPASFYRASVLRRVGLIDEGLHYAMDYDLLLRLAKGSRLIHLPIPLAGFRLHETAKTTAFTERHWEETLAVQRRHGSKYLSKQRLLYWRYRAFATLPDPLKMWFRRLRNSSKDWPILRAVGQRLGGRGR
jgi:glycosyltransferase involved in cell wall biosynthesis